MCKIVEEIVKEEKIDAALKLLAKKVLSNKEIADILNLDESVVDELAKKTSMRALTPSAMIYYLPRLF